MTRKTVGFNVLFFLVLLFFPAFAFCSAKNGNSGAGVSRYEEIANSMDESDSNHPARFQKSFDDFGPEKEEDEAPFGFGISEKPLSKMIDKLFTVNGIRNIISNELPGVPFLWDWLSLYFSSNMGDELVVDFKNDGIYIFNDGRWLSIYNGGIDPVNIVSFNSKLAVDWGPAYGIFIYNDRNWNRIYKGVPVERMAGFLDRLVVDFGVPYGIYEYSYQGDQWTKIYGKDRMPRDSMISLGDNLIVDFKTEGIYIYSDGVWENIYDGGIDPVDMVVFNGKLAVDFGLGYGIYVYACDTKTWKRIYRGMAVEKMAGFDRYLAVDLGSTYGLYIYEYDNNTWTRIYKGLPIENICGFSNKLAIDFGINYGIYEYTFETNIWNKIYHARCLRDDMRASDLFD